MHKVFTILAHAGEAHEEGLEKVAHYAAPWYLAVPIFIIAVAMIGYLTWLVSGRKPAVVIGVLSIVLLISGFTLFTISAAVSVIAITVGIILSGIQAFGSLTK